MLEFTINSLWGYSESTESNFKTYALGVQNSTGGPKFSVEKWSGWTKITGKNGPPDRFLVGPIFR